MEFQHLAVDHHQQWYEFFASLKLEITFVAIFFLGTNPKSIRSFQMELSKVVKTLTNQNFKVSLIQMIKTI